MPSNPMDSQSQANEGPKVDGAIPGYYIMLIVFMLFILGFVLNYTNRN